jgi:hypothetical protein
MYTSVIGKRFLEIYNKESGRNYSAKEFFEKEIFEIFYNHKKYFKWVVNSPFVQKLSSKERSGIKSFDDEQKRKLEKLYIRINSETADSSFAIGFPSATETFDTSGQLSNVILPMNEEDIFFSWIGAGFGIEIEGGQVWYINDEKLLLTIYEGWKVYREQLEARSIDLKGNEIDAWNTVWLEYKYNPQNITPKFIIDSYVDKITYGKDNGRYAIKRINWTRVLFKLARIFPNRQVMVFSTSYIFKKQKFSTIGFIILNLPQVQKLFQFYNKIFVPSNTLTNIELEKIYAAELSFENASTLGVIGLRAIKPSDLQDYMKDNKTKKEINEITIFNYKLWIIAMLNNEELLAIAKQIAQQLYEYFDGSEMGTRNKREQLIKEILGARKRESFFEALNDLSSSDLHYAPLVQTIKDRVMLKISIDNVRLFVSLIKIDFNAIKYENSINKTFKEK